MCTATRGWYTNLKLVAMSFAPYLGTNINTTFQNSKLLFFHRTLVFITQSTDIILYAARAEINQIRLRAGAKAGPGPPN